MNEYGEPSGLGGCCSYKPAGYWTERDEKIARLNKIEEKNRRARESKTNYLQCLKLGIRRKRGELGWNTASTNAESTKNKRDSVKWIYQLEDEYRNL